MTSMPRDTASELERLAAAVAHLRPDWKSADAFYEQRSEITAALRALANAPLVTRRILRFVAASQAPLPATERAPARPRRLVRRHRFPKPPYHEPRQAVLALPATIKR